MGSSPDGNKRVDILVCVYYYYSCTGNKIKRGSGNQSYSIKSISCWTLSGCNEPQRNVHTNLNSIHVLRLNTENVINSNCFDKEPFELYFELFYTENSYKIIKIKDDYILVLKKTLSSETIVIKLNSPIEKIQWNSFR